MVLFCLIQFANSLPMNGLKLSNVQSTTGFDSNSWIFAWYLPINLTALYITTNYKAGCLRRLTFSNGISILSSFANFIEELLVIYHGIIIFAFSLITVIESKVLPCPCRFVNISCGVLCMNPSVSLLINSNHSWFTAFFILIDKEFSTPRYVSNSFTSALCSD